MHKCGCCQLTLPLSDFYPSSSRSSGVSAYCRKCTKEKRDKNKDKHNASRRAKYNSSPEARQVYLDYHKKVYHSKKEQYKEYLKRHLSKKEIREYMMFANARRRSEQLGLDFNIELSDVVIPENCPYLNIPIILTSGKGRTKDGPSLDRIDNSKGYVKGNVQVISNLANTMKNCASKEELIIFATNILKVFK